MEKKVLGGLFDPESKKLDEVISMNTIKIDNKQAVIIAHRGLSGIEKENTNSAFVAAGNRSYYGIETDIHVTLDGKFVVFHDDTTGRICIDNMEVEKTTFDCLRGLKFTDVDGKKGRNDLVMPELIEYIRICKKYEKVCVLELKNPFSQKDIESVCKTIDEEGYLDHVIFISFCLENLLKLHIKYPHQPAQFLVRECDQDLINLLARENLGLDIKYTGLSKELIEQLHAAGIKVNCWTVDDPEAATELISWGVDMITTNILEGCVRSV